MTAKKRHDKHFFEIILLMIVMATACLFFKMGAYKMIVLNLFYLPIVLSGYYWGRSSASHVALFSVLSIAIVTTMDSSGFIGYDSPIIVYLSLTVWAGVLGLTAILVGTLCDERAAKLDELHEAYVGVAEVLSSYLQLGNTMDKPYNGHLAELSQKVAQKMNLSRKEIDDIRVGILLCDLGNVEITTRLIKKAVTTLEATPSEANKRTFMGMELVHSLGSALHNVLPLLVIQDEDVSTGLTTQADIKPEAIPIGVQIIRTVKAYDELVRTDNASPQVAAENALDELRNDIENNYNHIVINKLHEVIIETEIGAGLKPLYT